MSWRDASSRSLWPKLRSSLFTCPTSSFTGRLSLELLSLRPLPHLKLMETRFSRASLHARTCGNIDSEKILVW